MEGEALQETGFSLCLTSLCNSKPEKLLAGQLGQRNVILTWSVCHMIVYLIITILGHDTFRNVGGKLFWILHERFHGSDGSIMGRKSCCLIVFKHMLDKGCLAQAALANNQHIDVSDFTPRGRLHCKFVLLARPGLKLSTQPCA